MKDKAMRRLASILCLSIAISSCSREPRPTASDHAAAIQIYDREQKLLEDAEEILPEVSQKIHDEQLLNFVKTNRTKGAVPPHLTDDQLKGVDGLELSAAALGDSPEGIQLKTRLNDMRARAEAARDEWRELVTKFNHEMADENSAVRKEFTELCRKTDEFIAAEQQRNRVQAAKERLDAIESKLK